MSTILSWSGGKDSALALWTMRRDGAEPAALLTTMDAERDRVAVHGVRRELLRAQAAAVGLPLVEVEIPAGAPNKVYEKRLAAALTSPVVSQTTDEGARSLPVQEDTGGGASPPPRIREGTAGVDRPPLGEVDTVAFADLFLADIRAYRESQMAALGRRTAFPLWGHDTAALAREFVDAGFGATLVAVDTEQLDASFVGRRFDATLLDDLSDGVDPCGERGEFHTFVDSGPIFDVPVAVALGDRHDDGRFVYQDLVPNPRDRARRGYPDLKLSKIETETR